MKKCNINSSICSERGISTGAATAHRLYIPNAVNIIIPGTHTGLFLVAGKGILMRRISLRKFSFGYHRSSFDRPGAATVRALEAETQRDSVGYQSLARKPHLQNILCIAKPQFSISRCFRDNRANARWRVISAGMVTFSFPLKSDTRR